MASIRQDISGEPAAEGATIVINGEGGQILGYPCPDAGATVVPLPENESEVGKAVAELLAKIAGE